MLVRLRVLDCASDFEPRPRKKRKYCENDDLLLGRGVDGRSRHFLNQRNGALRKLFRLEDRDWFMRKVKVAVCLGQRASCAIHVLQVVNVMT